jgi:hypothetical protein
MPFKLPQFERTIDCTPLGYAGMTVVCILNPGSAEFVPPWGDAPADPRKYAEWEKKRKEGTRREPWQTEFHFQMGRILKSVTLPGEWIDPPQEGSVVRVLGTMQSVYDLMAERGFDRNILIWVGNQYAQMQKEWLASDVKNGNAASDDG